MNDHEKRGNKPGQTSCKGMATLFTVSDLIQSAVVPPLKTNKN